MTSPEEEILYEVFRDGVSQGTTPDTIFTQPVEDGTYSYTVRARDEAGNWSEQSEPISITVTSIPFPAFTGMSQLA